MMKKENAMKITFKEEIEEAVSLGWEKAKALEIFTNPLSPPVRIEGDFKNRLRQKLYIGLFAELAEAAKESSPKIDDFQEFADTAHEILEKLRNGDTLPKNL